MWSARSYVLSGILFLLAAGTVLLSLQLVWWSIVTAVLLLVASLLFFGRAVLEVRAKRLDGHVEEA
ncbi:hypothetical protein [Microbacterium sp. SLBN-111]|uniref:hypothetical protein n=1 Tax=Microbacterium sp. SLBN-111 TaxID=3377733 RepID=UPI003C70D7DB